MNSLYNKVHFYRKRFAQKGQKMIGKTKEKMYFSMIFTIIWGIIAHGYCYFNLSYSHDSLLVYQNDVEWQISLGRFLHPVFFKLRGNIYTPSLVGFLSLVFVGISVFLVCNLLNIDNKLRLCITSGIMTTNATVTLLNATYIHDIDIYTLSLLCAVSAVYVCRNCRCGILISVVLYIISLGLYQSFFQVSVFLFMILALKELLSGIEFQVVLRNGLKAICSLFAGLVSYYLVLKLVLFFTHITMSNSYNGLSEVGKYNGVMGIIKMVAITYYRVVIYFLNPRIYHCRIMAFFNVALALFSLFCIFSIIKKKKMHLKLLIPIAVLIVFMPFGMNIICFISQGMEHDLMIYSFFLVYILVYEIFAIWFETCRFEFRVMLLEKIEQNMMVLGLSVMLLNSVIYSNQIYLKKDLEYQTTMQTINRIVYRMEETEGYVIGETPVALIGSLGSSKLSVMREGFDNSGTGASSNMSVTYYDTYVNYFKYIMNYPINLVQSDICLEWAVNDYVNNMQPFPSMDSCQMIDGVMVVKLS